mgnify:CR=1 FL=1
MSNTVEHISGSVTARAGFDSHRFGVAVKQKQSCKEPAERDVQQDWINWDSVQYRSGGSGLSLLSLSVASATIDLMRGNSLMSNSCASVSRALSPGMNDSPNDAIDITMQRSRSDRNQVTITDSHQVMVGHTNLVTQAKMVLLKRKVIVTQGASFILPTTTTELLLKGSYLLLASVDG